MRSDCRRSILRIIDLHAGPGSLPCPATAEGRSDEDLGPFGWFITPQYKQATGMPRREARLGRS
jgi:hypothetical protein